VGHEQPPECFRQDCRDQRVPLVCERGGQLATHQVTGSFMHDRSGVVNAGRMPRLTRSCLGPPLIRARGAGQSAVARPTEATNRLQQAKDLLDALPEALARRVATMVRRAPIDCAPTSAGVVRHVRRDLLLADRCHTRARVVRLVSAQRSRVKATQLRIAHNCGTTSRSAVPVACVN
jgi:hypothetical protein